jgi:hypothetical protein
VTWDLKAWFATSFATSPTTPWSWREAAATSAMMALIVVMLIVERAWRERER